MSRKDYLYGEKGKELNARTEIYKKQLEGADLCEAEELHGLLAGKQEKEMAGEALETILRRGRLQETFPYLKEIKNNGTDIQVKYFELTKAGEKIYQDCTPQNDKMLAILLKFVSENELLNFTKTLLKIRNVIISLDSF